MTKKTSNPNPNLKARNEQLAAIHAARLHAFKNYPTNKNLDMKFKLAEYFKFDNGHYNV